MPSSTAPKKRHFATVSLLTLFALAVHGYHPFAEDGGLYVAEIKQLLNPTLYPHAAFVTQHLRFSVFAPLVAGLTRLSHLPLEWTLFALYILSIWTTLYTASLLASRITTSLASRRTAVALLACWLTLPIAGTSLMLSDPYLTARSLTTPLILVALAGVLDALRQQDSRARSMMTYSLIAAAVLHPLMAAYGWAAFIALGLSAFGAAFARRRAYVVVFALAIAVAAAVQTFAAPESPSYVAVERTRYYWFLSQWHWYELLGLALPLLILFWMARHREKPAWTILARGTFFLGISALAVAIGFARIGLATHLVARLQPLRVFQLVYIVMILLLGVWISEKIIQKQSWRWVAMLIVCAGPIFLLERSTYPASAHVELPGRISTNPWQQACLWIRANTPADALFAMDPHYIQAPGEDAQSFRAIAERDVLPDYSKDGGQAAILPTLAPLWIQGQSAQADIDVQSDAEREHHLRPLGIGWVILKATSPTRWPCAYQNSSVKVCRVP